MDIMQVLRPLEQLERKLAELYQWFADLFENDSDAAFTFHRMFLEERMHMNLIEYQRRLARGKPGAFGDIYVDLPASRRRSPASTRSGVTVARRPSTEPCSWPWSWSRARPSPTCAWPSGNRVRTWPDSSTVSARATGSTSGRSVSWRSGEASSELRRSGVRLGCLGPRAVLACLLGRVEGVVREPDQILRELRCRRE